MFRFALLAVLGIACSQPASDDLCARTVTHVFDRMLGDTRGAPPSDGERRGMDLARAEAIKTCRREGLDEAQARCLQDVATSAELMRVGSCPAIADRKPSWLQLPPTADALRDAGLAPPPL